MAIVLATLSAFLFGSSDFVGGYATRKNGALVVVLLSQAAGLIAAVLATVAFGDPFAGPRDLLFGALAGVGAVVGLVLLYHGLATTVVGVVSPVAAVVGALFPVVFGLAAGERPALTAWIGMVVAIPAIALLVWERPTRKARPPEAQPPENAPHPEPSSRDVQEGSAEEPAARTAPAGSAGEAAARAGRPALPRSVTAAAIGIAAGIGFGLSVIAISRVSAETTLWPIAAARVAGIAGLVPILILRRRPVRVARGSWIYIVLAGILDMTGTIAFLQASRGTLLAIAAVITSLYPAPTVILGAVVLKEHITATRGVGLVLAVAGIALIS
ncbi:MAG: EamA family transporter, partial [bacterium]